MTSLDPIPTTLSDHLRQLGLSQTAADLNDLIARATQKRWSPAVLLETVVRAELDARARQRVERRLKEARIGRFKAMADFEWTWPKQIHRPSVERVLTLDFVTKRENAIPYDERPPAIASGIRLGTPIVTTRGMREKEMDEIADAIDKVLSNHQDETVRRRVRSRMRALCGKFPVFKAYR